MCVAWWWREDPDADIPNENLIYYKIQTKARQSRNTKNCQKKPDYDKDNMDKPDTDMNGGEDLAMNMK